MMNRNQVAKSVRQDKEKHPEKYCKNPRCLWRGQNCPKHNYQEFLKQEESLEAKNDGLLERDEYRIENLIWEGER